MNGLTQTSESGEASLTAVEPNRWMVTLPVTRIDDFRTDRSKGWALGVQVDADNVSAFQVGEVRILEPSGPCSIAVDRRWTKTGVADPVVFGAPDGPVMSVRADIALLLHTPSGNPPAGLGVQLLLVEEEPQDETGDVDA